MLIAPALLAGGALHRRLVKRGHIDPLADDLPDGGGDGRPALTPNARETSRQVSAFRRAAGRSPVEIRNDEVREVGPA